MTKLKNTSAYRKTKRLLKQIIGEDLWTGIQFQCEKDLLGQDWCICPEGISKRSIVYSFGIGDDISFDRLLIERYGCQVFGFDPTPHCIEWIRDQQLPDGFHFFPYGISNYDGTVKLFPRVRKKGKSNEMLTLVNESKSAADGIDMQVFQLKTILSKLNHSHIDVLKMDIEASEYSVIDNILDCGIEVYQILIEFHHRFNSVDKKLTLDAISKLNRSGYYIYFISQLGREYSFINKSMFLEKTANC